MYIIPLKMNNVNTFICASHNISRGKQEHAWLSMSTCDTNTHGCLQSAGSLLFCPLSLLEHAYVSYKILYYNKTNEKDLWLGIHRS